MEVRASLALPRPLPEVRASFASRRPLPEVRASFSSPRPLPEVRASFASPRPFPEVRASFASPRPLPEVRAKRASKEGTRVAQDEGEPRRRGRVSLRMRASLALVSHQPCLLALPIFFFLGSALVRLALAARETEFHLQDPARIEIEGQRKHRHAPA